MPLIQVHIVTGFLGVGKTSCIQHLIDNKPENERWAVLVNEYGQQGIDGSLFRGDELIIKQVAGGCACCAALLPFQTALNQLIRHEQLDRIFIEPSGLGHVDNIAALLQESSYQKRLKLNDVVCVIDPRHLSQPKYRFHDLYLRQLSAAQVLVANKCDVVSQDDLALFEKLTIDFQCPSVTIQQAKLSLEDIQPPVDKSLQKSRPLFQMRNDELSFYTQVLEFDITHWQLEALQQALIALGLSRIKALLIQGDQVAAINISDADASMSYFPLFTAHQQRSVIECIDVHPIDIDKITRIMKQHIQTSEPL